MMFYIDNSPDIDGTNRTFTVDNNILDDSEISITINGLMGIYNDDIDNVSDNVITLKDGLDVDYEGDAFVVFYEGVE